MLDARIVYAAEYGGALADHLPMALHALTAMGADRTRNDAFARYYVEAKGLRVLERDDAEMQARDALYERMLAHGWEPVFCAELRSLAAGLGAGAFHAFIRAAYGILAGDPREIAAALVYWRTAALDLGTATDLPADTEAFDPGVALARVRERLGHVHATLASDETISERMQAVVRDPAFDLACARPNGSGAFVSQMAHVTVRAFAAGRNFTLLHAMTATHALRIIEPYADDRDALYESFWRAYVAAYVSAGALPLRSESDFARDLVAAASWDVLIPLARASDDEHVVKVAFTTWSEDRAYRDPLYRVAAARYLKLI